MPIPNGTFRSALHWFLQIAKYCCINKYIAPSGGSASEAYAHIKQFIVPTHFTVYIKTGCCLTKIQRVHAPKVNPCADKTQRVSILLQKLISMIMLE